MDVVSASEGRVNTDPLLVAVTTTTASSSETEGVPITETVNQAEEVNVCAVGPDEDDDDSGDFPYCSRADSSDEEMRPATPTLEEFLENGSEESDSEEGADKDKIRSVRKNIPCLICFDEVGMVSSRRKFYEKWKDLSVNCGRPKGQQKKNLMEENMRVVFLLKNIAKLETEKLINFMENLKGEHPKEWVRLCDSCSELVTETVRTRELISDLEEKLKNFEREIVDRIKISAKDSWRKQCWYGTPNALLVTRAARETVCGRSQNPEEGGLPNEVDDDRGETWEGPPFDEGYDDEEAQYINGEVVVACGSKKNTPSNGQHGQRRVKTKRKRTQQETVNKGERGKMYSCTSCPAIEAMSFNQFLQHLIWHWQRPLKCTVPECSAHLPHSELLIDKHWCRFHKQVELTADVQKSKMAQFSPGNLWGCGKCSEKFSSFAERDDHERSSHNFVAEVPLSCPHCSSHFRNISEIRLHKALSHPQEAALSCSYCLEQFARSSVEGVEYLDVEELQFHVRDQHSLTPKVEDADADATKKRILAPAIVFHTCPLCGDVFQEAQYHKLDKHLRKAHGIKEKSKVFECPICLEATHPTELKGHLKKVHAANVICDTCGEEMKPGELGGHQLRMHGILMKGLKLLKCPEEGCEYTTTKRQGLERHSQSHKKTKDFYCSFCGKAFAKESYLVKHEKIHRNAETKPYKCKVCGASFAVETYLYMHNRIHRKVRPFPSVLRKRRKLDVESNQISEDSSRDNESSRTEYEGMAFPKLPSSSSFPTSRPHEMKPVPIPQVGHASNNSQYNEPPWTSGIYYGK